MVFIVFAQLIRRLQEEMFSESAI